MKKYGCLLVDDILLEGHIGITKELIKYLSAENKYYYGSDESSSINLVKVNVFPILLNVCSNLLSYFCHYYAYTYRSSSKISYFPLPN